MVEQLTRNEQVVGPTPMGGSGGYAGIAQLVEHQLPKLRVASSSLVSRSNKRRLREQPLLISLDRLRLA